MAPKTKNTEFNPDKVSERDHISLNVCSGDRFFAENFNLVIMFIRFICYYYNCYLGFREYCSKLVTGRKEDYGEDAFFILNLTTTSETIKLLIYKPNIYVLGVWAGGKWWQVQDFYKHTKLRFRGAEVLPFASSYRGIPDKLSFEILHNSIESISRTAKSVNRANKMGVIEGDFKNLCVFFAEAARFKVISELLVAHISPYLPTLTLSKLQTSLFNNWSKYSAMFIYHQMGYVWDLQELLKTAGVEGEEEPNIAGLNMEEEQPVVWRLTYDEAQEVLAILLRPKPTAFLALLEKVWNYEEILETRVRRMTNDEWELLDGFKNEAEKIQNEESQESKKASDFQFLRRMKRKMEAGNY